MPENSFESFPSIAKREDIMNYSPEKQKLIFELIHILNNTGVESADLNNAPPRITLYIQKKYLPESVLELPQLQEAATNGLLRAAREGRYNVFYFIKKAFDLPDEVLRLPEIQKFALEKIRKAIQKRYFPEGLSEDFINFFLISGDLIKMEEIKEAALCSVKRSLADGNLDMSLNTIKLFNSKDELFKSSEFQKLALFSIKKSFLENRIEMTYRINIDRTTPGVRNKAVDDIVDIQNILGISDQDLEEIIIEAIEYSLEWGSASSALRIIEQATKFGFLRKESIDLDSMQDKAKRGMIRKILLDKTQDAEEMAKNFNVPPDIVQLSESRPIIKEEFLKILKGGVYSLDGFKTIEKTGFYDEDISPAWAIFGSALTKESYDIICKIRNGSLDEETKSSMGIKELGKAGIIELQNRLKKFKQDIVDPNFNPEILLKNKFLANYFKVYIRYEKSSWGEHTQISFDKTIENLVRNQKGNRWFRRQKKIEPLSEKYFKSGEVLVDEVDKELQNTFQFSEQALSRISTLKGSLKEALALTQEKKPYSTISQKLRLTLEEIISKLEEKVTVQKNLLAVKSLEQKINLLRSLNLTNVKDLQDKFKALAQFKDFHESLRQLIFFLALHKNKNFREQAREITEKEEVDFDDISWINNFIETVVNEETWSKYFTDKKALKAFQELINIRALREELVRAQDQEIKGTTKLEFIPSRGLMLEFSGHIADACWASRYDSISSSFPNFSAVTIVKNKETRYERLAGSCLLIETQGADDTPLLIIRGLNPIENIINSLSIDDFYRKFVSYTQKIAHNLGRKLAIVIDDHSGGAATNRPALFSYLEKIKIDFKPIELKSEEDTTFNGYNITKNTFLVS